MGEAFNYLTLVIVNVRNHLDLREFVVLDFREVDVQIKDDPGAWEENFKSHHDSKPRGPSAIGSSCSTTVFPCILKMLFFSG